MAKGAPKKDTVKMPMKGKMPMMNVKDMPMKGKMPMKGSKKGK